MDELLIQQGTDVTRVVGVSTNLDLTGYRARFAIEDKSHVEVWTQTQELTFVDTGYATGFQIPHEVTATLTVSEDRYTWGVVLISDDAEPIIVGPDDAYNVPVRVVRNEGVAPDA